MEFHCLHPVTNLEADEDKAVSDFVSAVIKNALEEVNAKNFVSEVIFAALLRKSPESDVVQENVPFNSSTTELNTRKMPNIPKCHSCPAVILCEDLIKEDSPSPPPTKNLSLKTRLWRRMRRIFTRTLLPCIFNKN